MDKITPGLQAPSIAAYAGFYDQSFTIPRFLRNQTAAAGMPTPQGRGGGPPLAMADQVRSLIWTRITTSQTVYSNGSNGCESGTTPVRGRVGLIDSPVRAWCRSGSIRICKRCGSVRTTRNLSLYQLAATPLRAWRKRLGRQRAGARHLNVIR